MKAVASRGVRVAVLGAAMVACAGCTHPPCGLTVWAIGSEAGAIERMVPGFEASHRGVLVCVQQLPWSSAQVRLLSAVAAGDPPDVAQVGDTDLATLVALHALRPQPRIADDFFPAALRVARFHGVSYGVPWYIDTRLLFYLPGVLRRAGFARPARTWSGWLKQMRAVQRILHRGQYALLAPTNEAEFLEVLALQEPAPMLRDGGRYGNFASASFRRALSFYRSLYAEHLAPRINNRQLVNLWWEMARGDFVFYVSGPWNIGEFRHFLPPRDQRLWMTAPMPGPDGPGVSTIGGSDFVIFRASAHAGLARRFIRYMLADKQQLRLYELTGDLPARRGVWRLPPLADNVKLRAFRAQLKRIRPFVAVPEWNEIMSGMRRMAARVAAGDASVRGATRRFDRTVDGWLADRRDLRARSPRSKRASAVRRSRSSEAR